MSSERCEHERMASECVFCDPVGRVASGPATLRLKKLSREYRLAADTARNLSDEDLETFRSQLSEQLREVSDRHQAVLAELRFRGAKAIADEHDIKVIG